MSEIQPKTKTTQKITLKTRKQRLQEAKALVKQFAKLNDSVVEELISERHEAVGHE